VEYREFKRREQRMQITTLDELRKLLGSPHPLTESKIYSEINPTAKDFIETSPLVFVATSDADGQPTVSPKGDHAGFVKVIDQHTLLIPERPGNKLLHGLSNIIENGKIGLIFLAPGTEESLRVNGSCEIFHDEQQCQEFTANGKPALLVMKVTVEQCFFHCSKAFKRSKAWQPDTWPSQHKVSFGEQIANQKVGKGKLAAKVLAKVVDAAVDVDSKKNL
jgi:PPOX class probable FMN-dependent enzyme